MLRAVSILIAFVASTVQSAPTDITSRAESAFHAYVGKRVQLCGRYSVRGKTTAYIVTSRATVALTGVSIRRFSEGHPMCVTGALHYWQKPQFVDACLANSKSEFYFTTEDPSFRVLSR
jgi:hypothetical protein